MSEKPTPDRDYFLTRIARALGCAGYSVEECDAILAWVQVVRPANGPGRTPCGACGATGRRAPEDPSSVSSGDESINGMQEQTRFLIQGICLACRGRGYST